MKWNERIKYSNFFHKTVIFFSYTVYIFIRMNIVRTYSMKLIKSDYNIYVCI